MKKKEKKLTSKELFEESMSNYEDKVQSLKPDVVSQEIIETIPSSFDQLIQRELTKFDVVVPAVNELAKEFMPLKISSIDDKEGYSEVTKALRFIVSKRTAVEEKRKELKADSLAYGRAVDARAKEITAMLEPIESHLKNEKVRIDDIIERLKAEEEERKNKFINDRISALIGLNMFQTMTEFVWKSKLNPEEEESFLRVNLELFSDDDFNSFVEDLKKRIDSENKIIAERDAKVKAEAEELERKRKEIDEEKHRVEKEMQEMKAERAVGRRQKLAELGLGTLSFNPHWVFMKKAGGIQVINIIHEEQVLNLSGAEWNTKLEEIKTEVAKLHVEEATAESVEQKIREEKLKEANVAQAKAEEERKKAEAAAEAERLASMSDKDLYLDYVSRLYNVPAPELKTKKWQSYVNTIAKTIETFKNMN